MDTPQIGFPPEADNTVFAVTPAMPAGKLEDLFSELVWRETLGCTSHTEPIDFNVENRWFKGRVRLHLSTKHLSDRVEQRPLFFLDGPVYLLDPSGTEYGSHLCMGGNFNFARTPPGIARIWHEVVDIRMLDAS